MSTPLTTAPTLVALARLVALLPTGAHPCVDLGVSSAAVEALLALGAVPAEHRFAGNSGLAAHTIESCSLTVDGLEIRAQRPSQELPE